MSSPPFVFFRKYNRLGKIKSLVDWWVLGVANMVHAAAGDVKLV